MAYQNVGTPRFIIDWLQWWKSLGLIRGHQIWNARAIEPIETFTSENDSVCILLSILIFILRITDSPCLNILLNQLRLF